MMRGLKPIMILALVLFFSPAAALELAWEIHSEWHMLTCAGFGYHLVFDNTSGGFTLKYGDECGTIIRPVYKGKFKIERESLLLDFGEIKAYYYLKRPYLPPCDNLGDSLTLAEQQLVCDPSQVESAKDFLPPGTDGDKVFLKKAALFPLRIEASQKDKRIEELLRDLKTHCFLQIELE
jgi:hypothetical protein